MLPIYLIVGFIYASLIAASIDPFDLSPVVELDPYQVAMLDANPFVANIVTKTYMEPYPYSVPITTT